MADPVALDSWSAEGIHLSDVVAALGELQDRSDGPVSSARTAVMTLVGVAHTEDDARGASAALRVLAGHHPSRIVLVRPEPDHVASLGARTTLYALDSGNHRTTFEEIVLEVGGQAAHHLDSLVDALTLSDLPVAVWYVNSIPQASDPLLSVATAVLIDSRDAPDPSQLRTLLALARRRVLVDLSWSRLQPWRELLAGLFEPVANRPWLESLDEVEISGKTGPRRLLGGWLIAQTGVSPRRVSLHDARHVSIRLAATRDGNRATFSVERAEEQRLLVAEAAVPGAALAHSTSVLPERPLASSVATALTHLRPDPVWERALSSAAALGD